MDEAEAMKAAIKDLKKTTDDRIQKLKEAVKITRESRQTQSVQQPHQD
ncbi:hypothetical protein ES703_43608 [subsurface metagenome]